MENSYEFRYFSESVFDAKVKCPIFLIGFFRSCAIELCKIRGVLSDVSGFIDSNYYDIFRSVAINDCVINIFPDEYINSLSGNEILIILGGDYNAKYKKLITEYATLKKFKNIYYFPGKEGRYMRSFLEDNKNISMQNIIIFRSGVDANVKFNDWEYADNPRALFEYMIRNHFDDKYKLVWMARNPYKYINHIMSIKKNANVDFISYDDALSDESSKRDKYYRYLCFAKYVFFCQSYMFARNLRKGQVRVQLWHGCGFKSNYNRGESIRYEYMTVTSDMYAKLHAGSFELNDSQMLVTGLPKNDWVLNPIEGWQKTFNVPESSKYIFWLPTYRTKTSFDNILTEVLLNQETGLPIMQSKKMMEQMNEMLKSFDITLVIKLHPSQDKTDVINLNLSNIVLIDNTIFVRELIDINQILGYADALISDYSSVATGYMLLDRPIAFTLDDIDLYHGFHWPKEELRDWLPGEEIYDFDDFVRFVRDVAEGRDTSREKRHRLMPYFHKYTDGNSCARVLEALGITKD